MPLIAAFLPAASDTAEAVSHQFGSTAWAITLVLVFGLFTFDFIHAARNPHEVAIREAAIWVSIYISMAVIFGLSLAFWGPEQTAQSAESGGWSLQFFAGYITELSLSVDNLFVFVLIFSSFAVPRVYQQKVLLIGIIIALILRLTFILIGAAALAQFSWLFYFFGLFLIYTAVNLVRNHGNEPDHANNKVVLFAERVIPTTREYHDGNFFAKINGKRVATPLFLVFIAIFMTDLLFAMDSIPAIFGLTSEPYIVFVCNAFALMGLRQMFFLLDGMLDRLVYLTYGLAAILGFIGVKLLLHAMHESGLDVPTIGTLLSLVVIIGVLVITVVLSLRKVAKDPSVLEAHDVTGHHHPQGKALDNLSPEEGDGAK